MSFGCLNVEDPEKWSVPSGGLSDLYLLRFMLSAYLLQLLVTWKPVIGQKYVEAPPAVTAGLLRLVKDVKSAAGKETDWLEELGSEEAIAALESHVTEGMEEFLRPCALFFHALTLVPPPEALKGEVSPFYTDIVHTFQYLRIKGISR